MSQEHAALAGFSTLVRFADVNWGTVPQATGVYVVYDQAEVVYVGMAGRNGGGNLRKRLYDHATGQMVNMFAQYLYFARVQFVGTERITHPRSAQAACRGYLVERCGFRFLICESADAARLLEARLKRELRPAFNGLD